MKARQENELTKRGDRMPKTSFTHFTILLKTILKMLNFTDMNIMTNPTKLSRLIKLSRLSRPSGLT